MLCISRANIWYLWLCLWLLESLTKLNVLLIDLDSFLFGLLVFVCDLSPFLFALSECIGGLLCSLLGIALTLLSPFDCHTRFLKVVLESVLLTKERFVLSQERFSFGLQLGQLFVQHQNCRRSLAHDICALSCTTTGRPIPRMICFLIIIIIQGYPSCKTTDIIATICILSRSS